MENVWSTYRKFAKLLDNNMDALRRWNSKFWRPDRKDTISSYFLFWKSTNNRDPDFHNVHRDPPTVQSTTVTVRYVSTKKMKTMKFGQFPFQESTKVNKKTAVDQMGGTWILWLESRHPSPFLPNLVPAYFLFLFLGGLLRFAKSRPERLRSGTPSVEDRGLQVPMTLEHDKFVGTRFCDCLWVFLGRNAGGV